MFGFLKKNKEKQPAKLVPEEPQLSETEQEQLKDQIERIKIQVKELEAADPLQDAELAKLYESLGLAYEKLSQVDEAILALEKSLDLKLSIGDGYKKLMSLYNAKRAEAARNGDDEGIEKYMNKMDDMRQIAKKVTVGGK
ncbi:tetratricopeptide repeat protein [Enterococcus sp. AZ103]|uniref:tetratricopeptide repeat protein n=1 Tax=Enterococcus sp. AZ103 TaxID=2774628 RepID=UPI003F260DA9